MSLPSSGGTPAHLGPDARTLSGSRIDTRQASNSVDFVLTDSAANPPGGQATTFEFLSRLRKYAPVVLALGEGSIVVGRYRIGRVGLPVIGAAAAATALFGIANPL